MFGVFVCVHTHMCVRTCTRVYVCVCVCVSMQMFNQ